MRGFIDRNGEYYESDEPLTSSDSEVELRPSEMYVMGPEGNWILDRRALAMINKVRANRGRKQIDYADSELDSVYLDNKTERRSKPRRDTPKLKEEGTIEPEQRAKGLAVDFLIKHWVTISSVVVWAFGTYATVSQKFQEMDSSINIMTKRVEVISVEQKEHAKLQDAKLQALESRYQDLNLFLQQLAAKSKGQ